MVDHPENSGTLRTVPTWYSGTRFRSTLEANWAATLDSLQIGWTYEPVAVQLEPGVGYLCDFHLSALDVWAEVKGPHNERMDKVATFDRILESDPWNVRQPMVIVLRPSGPHGVAVWEAPDGRRSIVIALCPECDAYTFLDTEGAWQCRRCYFGGQPNRHDNKFWKATHYRVGDLKFVRAPRRMEPSLPRAS